MRNTKPIQVLFVCMGNICRSPTAHGVFKALVDDQGLSDQILVDSAGTHSFHAGNPPDLRSQAAALSHGVNLSKLKARALVVEDFLNFDFLIAMDRANYARMQSMQPENSPAQLAMMLEYSNEYSQHEVPDPYYGDDGFDLVFDMITDASTGLLKTIRQQYSI
jgi:protein-tyrosine phosphatase